MDLVRQVLDYVPAEVLHSLADDEEVEIFDSIDARLDRTVIERIETEEPIDTQDADATQADEEAQADAWAPQATAGDADEQEPAAGDRPVEVVLEDTEPSEELAGQQEEPDAWQAPPSSAEHPPWPDADGNGHDADVVAEASPFDSLNEFTVVAPPRGTIQGNWSVTDEPIPIEGASVARDTELDEDSFWAGEDLEDDLDLGDLGTELEDDFDDLDDLDADLLAEADPEQDELEAWEDEDEEEQFWEDLLEGDTSLETPEEADADEEPWPEDEIPTFESAEQEPAQAETVEEENFDDLWDDEPEPAEQPEPAAKEEEDFDDLWDDFDDEEELAEPAEEELSFEEVDFQVADEPDPDEEGVSFEQVDFQLADKPEPVAQQAPGEDDEALAEPDEEPLEVEAETTAEADWPDPSGSGPGPEAEELDAPEPTTPLPADEPFTHGPYTLYHKVVETADGDQRDLYFFARAPPDDAAASELPDGYDVGVNERTGVPFVREERD